MYESSRIRRERIFRVFTEILACFERSFSAVGLKLITVSVSMFVSLILETFKRLKSTNSKLLNGRSLSFKLPCLLFNAYFWHSFVNHRSRMLCLFSVVLRFSYTLVMKWIVVVEVAITAATVFFHGCCSALWSLFFSLYNEFFIYCRFIYQLKLFIIKKGDTCGLASCTCGLAIFKIERKIK